MITPQHFRRPLSGLDLQLAPLQAWSESSQLCYLACTGDAEATSTVVALMTLHCPNADTKTLLRLAKRGNRHSCDELLRWVAYALVMESTKEKT